MLKKSVSSISRLLDLRSHDITAIGIIRTEARR